MVKNELTHDLLDVSEIIAQPQILPTSPCLISFDVFDTLLTRTYAKPHDLFLALGIEAKRRGLVSIPSEDLAHQRVNAEIAARQSAPGGEPELAEIYAVLGQSMGLSQSGVDKLLCLELELEEEALRPVPGMLRRIAIARNRVNSVFFLSDMYLPSEFVERLLATHNFFKSGDVLYVSGQARASKASGKLFARVRAERGIAAPRWVHTGDDELADQAVPAKQGITTQLLSKARLTRYEAFARGGAKWPVLWRSHLAGAMRLARLEGPEPGEPASVVWNTGANIVGPLLFGFVNWCLREATARGLRRLYFIARDGQVLHKIGQRICSAWGFPIECRYLYGSRQAFRVPAFTEMGNEQLKWLLPTNHDLTVEHVFARLGLKPKEVEEVLTKAGLGPATWCVPLSHSQLRNLAELLCDDEIQRSVSITAERARETLVKYLDQEGFFDGVPFGVVDIGWHGNLQRSLSQCLNLTGHEKEAKLTGFYMGLYPSVVVPKDQVLLDYWSQFNDPWKNLNHQNITMFEAFVAADHGSTTAYEEKDGRIVPVLVASQNAEAVKWGVPQLQAATLAFCSKFLELVTESPVPEFQEVTRKMFEMFYFKPSQDEAKVWGSFPLNGQPIENMRGQIVPQFQSECQALATVLDVRRRPTGWWMEGSLAIKSSPSLFLFLQLLTLRRFAGAALRHLRRMTLVRRLW